MDTLRDLVFPQPRPSVSPEASAAAWFATAAPCYQGVVQITTAECADDGLYSAVPEPPSHENDDWQPRCDQLLAIETDLNDRLQQGSRGVYTDVQEEDLQGGPQEEPQEEPQDDDYEEDVDLNVCSSDSDTDDEPDREVIDLCLSEDDVEAQQTGVVVDLCSDSEDEGTSSDSDTPSPMDDSDDSYDPDGHQTSNGVPL